MKAIEQNYAPLAKYIHLGLAGFGIAAYLTAELAEGGMNSAGFYLHAYLGLSLAAVMLLRLGVSSTQSSGFVFGTLFSAAQWRMVLADLRGLVSFKVPQRGHHEGLAGLVQALGLLIFAMMATTGTGLFLLRGSDESMLFEAFEEIHELGEGLIPLYLALHVGAVLLHTLVGWPVWQRMFKFR